MVSTETNVNLLNNCNEKGRDDNPGKLQEGAIRVKIKNWNL